MSFYMTTTGIDIPSLQVVQDDQGFHVGQEDPERKTEVIGVINQAKFKVCRKKGP